MRFERVKNISDARLDGITVDATVVDNAIRQRDEAVRLLMAFYDFDGCDCDSSLDDQPWTAPLHASDCDSYLRWRAFDEQARAFLANFKEDSTND